MEPLLEILLSELNFHTAAKGVLSNEALLNLKKKCAQAQVLTTGLTYEYET